MKIHSNRIYTADDYKALNTYSCGKEVYNREKDGIVFNTPYIEKLAKQ